MLNYLKTRLTDEDSQDLNSESPFKLVESVLSLSNSLRSSSSGIRESLTPDNIAQILDQHYQFELISGPEDDPLSFGDLFLKVTEQEATSTSDDGFNFNFVLGDENYVYRYLSKDQIDFSTLAVGEIGFVRTDHLFETIVLSLLMGDPRPDREIQIFDSPSSAIAHGEGLIGTLQPADSGLLANLLVDLDEGWVTTKTVVVLVDDMDTSIDHPKVWQELRDYVATIHSHGIYPVLHDGRVKRIFAYVPHQADTVFYEEVGDNVESNRWFTVPVTGDDYDIESFIRGLHSPSSTQHGSFRDDLLSGVQCYVKMRYEDEIEQRYIVSINPIVENGYAGTFISSINSFLKDNPTTAMEVIVGYTDPREVFFSGYGQQHQFSYDIIYPLSNQTGALPIASVVESLQNQADYALDYANLLERLLTGEGFTGILDKLLDNPGIGRDVKEELQLRASTLYTTLEERIISFLSFFNPSDDADFESEIVGAYSGTHPIWALVNKFNFDWSNMWTAYVSYAQFSFAISKATWVWAWNLVKAAGSLVRRLIAPLTLSKEVQRFRSFSIDETFELPKVVQVRNIPLPVLRDWFEITNNYYRFSSEFKVTEIFVEDETETHATLKTVTYYRLSDFTGYNHDEKLLRVGANRIERDRGTFKRVSKADAYDKNFLFSILATSMEYDVASPALWTDIWNPDHYLHLDTLRFRRPIIQADGSTIPGRNHSSYRMVGERGTDDPTNFFFPYNLDYVLATASDIPPHVPWPAPVNPPMALYHTSLTWNGYDILELIDKNVTNEEVFNLFESANVVLDYNSNYDYPPMKVLHFVKSKIDSPLSTNFPRTVHHAWRLKTDAENMTSFKNFSLTVASIVVVAIAVKKFVALRKNMAVRLSLLEGQRLNEITKATPDVGRLKEILKAQRKTRAIASIFGLGAISAAGLSLPSTLSMNDESYDILVNVDRKLGDLD